MVKATIAVLGGDGVGPEVTAAAVRVLRVVAAKWGHRFSFTESPVGGCSIDRYGIPLSPETLELCRASDAILLGAVGGPKWDDPRAKVRPEQGLLALRKELGLFANLRPVKHYAALADVSPLKPERVRGVDLLVVRELTGGLYFGEPRYRKKQGNVVKAVDTLEYSDVEIRRVIDLGFRLAGGRRQKVTSVDKANVLESSRLWREIAVEVGREYPGVALEQMLVDTAAMRIVTSAADFDVIVTENMFGDILTDEASVLAGSLGLLPSASLGEGKPGLYEPIHGSAPDIAGQGIANPIGAVLSAALMLRYSFSLEKEALGVESAVERVLAGGSRTRDLGGSLGTEELTDRIVRLVESA